MNQEWIWVAAFVAIPVIFFGTLEVYMLTKRRRCEAIARRRKGPPRRSGSSD